MEKEIFNVGYAAYQHKMEIVFKCIQAEIAELDADQERWRNSKSWNPILPPAGYERNEKAIRTLMSLSRRLRANLKLNRVPKPPVFIGEEE